MTWKDYTIGLLFGVCFGAIGGLIYYVWELRQQMEILLKLPWEK